MTEKRKQNTDAVYKAFNAIPVSAYAITYKGEHVGLVAWKHPKDGAGRVYCYLHIFGFQMVRGQAAGFGYDKRGVSWVDALDYLADAESLEQGETPFAQAAATMIETLRGFDGAVGWETMKYKLEDVGFQFLRAV